jgi:hypothetical protein
VSRLQNRDRTTGCQQHPNHIRRHLLIRNPPSSSSSDIYIAYTSRKTDDGKPYNSRRVVIILASQAMPLST